MSCDTPATVDLSWYRGDTEAQQFRLLRGTVPVDLTGALAAAWAINGDPSVHYDLTVTIDTPPTDGYLTIKPPVGGIPAGKYRYDVELTLTGAVETWIKGRLAVEQDITNAA